MPKTKYIRILRDCNALIRQTMNCGDAGCCSWFEWELQKVYKGEEFEEDEIQIENLAVGDYEIIQITL